MLFIKKNIFFLLYLIFSANLVFSQTTRVSSYRGLSHILSENGLSQNTVHHIHQDSKGFMWFATEDGLNKYDGYGFTIYKNNQKDKYSIPDNFIWTIYEDKKGNLWIGTNSGGLSKFDYENERFVSFKNNPEDTNSLTLNNVRAIFEDRKGNIWVGTENGLDKFDQNKNIFIHYKHNPVDQNSLSNNVILAIFEDSDGDLWIGSDGGLDRYNEKGDNFFNYSFKNDNPNSLSNNIVLSIYQDKNGFLWIGTLKGITLFDKKNQKFTRFIINSSDINSINSNRINKLLEDESGILWVGTGNGLFQFDRVKKEFRRAKSSPMTNDILSSNNVLSLCEDNSGLIWIGTAEDGIVKYDKKRTKFKHYSNDPFNNNSISHNTIRSIWQDENNIIWIGTLGGGLNRFDSNANKFIHYKNNSSDQFSLSDNSVSAIFKDKSGYLWIGTWGGGLNRTASPLGSDSYNLKFINYKNDQTNSKSLGSNIIQAIYEDSKGRMWIGTGNGLSFFDQNKNEFINFTNDPDNSNSLSSNQVQSCILEDRNGNIWIGTWNGLNKISYKDIENKIIDPGTVKFKRYRFQPENENSLSDERVISAFEDKDGNLWFGTFGGGLNKLTVDQQNITNEKFINYSDKDGLPSNIIYKILSDDSGNLWLSTDNGLSMFDTKKETFKNYDASDGLQGNQFFWSAGFKTKNGELIFGGTNGFNIFNPEELMNNNFIPPVVITNFQIFNKPVEINKENSPLKKSIYLTKEIELSYDQNVFSLEFAALDFTVPGKNRYAYKMEGFDNDWIYSGNRHYVTYTNLDPGEYIFRVKGSNNDEVWNEKGSSLVIKILPPLWKQGWFISLILIFVTAIVVSIIYFRVKHLLDIERLRTKLAADLHDNIGSSLTEISILSEVISKKIKSEDEGVKKSLTMISSNSRNLIDNMSDIVWLVNPNRDSLYDLILRLRDTYSELSSHTNISFRSENIKSLEKVSLSMEHRQHLYLIFKEAINNCITHSECSEISLDASVKGKKLQMTLKDNGKGFFIDEISRNGNGLNNIQNRAENIGGVLHIFSKKGEGTTVRFEGDIL
ncbi:MAG TPA: two-component regulator propeller domain-containing protein [Ignavibacteriaceae bacterium]|nr:two-component regulator propeller domain-containing protein [Ignavibacteriaceae bacterium]